MRCSNWCLAIDRSIAFNTFQEAIYPIHWFIHVVNIISRYISNTLPKCHKQTSKIHKRMEYVFVAHIKYLLKTERYVCIMSGTRMVRSRVKNRMSSIVQNTHVHRFGYCEWCSLVLVLKCMTCYSWAQMQWQCFHSVYILFYVRFVNGKRMV